MTTGHKDLYKSFERFNAIDYATGVGALQLLPQNAERQYRLNRASNLAYALSETLAKPDMSSKHWRRTMNQPPISDLASISMEDPAEHTFTSSLHLFGEEYTVFQGLTYRLVDALQILLKTICQTASHIPDQFAMSVATTARAILRISHKIARHAQIDSHTPPASSNHRSSIIVPPAHEFRKLKEAVTFTDKQLRATIGQIPSHAIQAMIVKPPFARGSLVDILDSKCYSTRPLLLFSNELVIPNPPALLSALQHYIVTQAQKHSLNEIIMTNVMQHVDDLVQAHLLRMTWHAHHWPSIERVSWATESVWNLDTDKVAHVIVLVEDICDKRRISHENRSPIDETLSERLRSRISTVRQALESQGGIQRDIFHLVVAQDLGSETMMILDLNDQDRVDARAPDIAFLEQADLGVIARLLQGDRLGLWKFTKLYQELNRSVHMHSWSLLDIFGLYHANNNSFYMSDQSRVTDVKLLSVPTTFGSALRIGDAVKHTQRETMPLGSRRLIALEKFNGTHDRSLFVNHPIFERNITFRSRINGLTIWIKHDNPPATVTPPERQAVFHICHGIAYWLKEIASSIGEDLISLRRLCKELEIRVTSVERDASDDTSFDTTRVPPWFSLHVASLGLWQLRVYSTVSRALSGPLNLGERELVSRLVTCVLQLTAKDGAIDPSYISHLVDLHVPVGNKKMILFTDPQRNPGLLQGNLSSARTVQKHDLQATIDDAANQLQIASSAADGRVPDDDRNDVLNNIVEIHFRTIRRHIASLDSHTLMRFLIERHEAIVYQLAHEALTLPTRLACFGKREAYMSEITDKIEQLVEADASLRFLIEYAAACPPDGTTIISLSVFDQLMAASNELITKGLLSDSVHYNSADLRLRHLHTGRLHIESDGQYLTGVQEFRAIRSNHDSASYERHFAAHWKQIDDTYALPNMDTLDNAMIAEFGFSMTDLTTLIVSMTNLSHELSSEPSELGRAEVVTFVAADLDCSTENVNRILQELTYTARRSFFTKRHSDAYPWRYNRNLSYIRRPLILQRRKGKEVLLWGFRHLNRTGRLFFENIGSGRLKARSKVMQQYMSKSRNIQTSAFNELVAKTLGSYRNVETRMNVEHFGSHRVETSRSNALGDIDVLAINRNLNQVLAIESKDFSQARNPFEINNEIRKLLDGDNSAVAHHSKRLKWLQENLDVVLDSFGIRCGTRQWVVEGLIVVSSPLFSPLIRSSPVRVVVLGDLQDKLAELSWR